MPHQNFAGLKIGIVGKIDVGCQPRQNAEGKQHAENVMQIWRLTYLGEGMEIQVEQTVKQGQIWRFSIRKIIWAQKLA